MNRLFYQIRIKYSAILLFFLPWILSSCDTDSGCPRQVDTSGIPLSITIEALEKEIRNIEEPAALRAFMARNPILSEFFFKKSPQANDSLWIEEILQRFKNPHIDTLFMETERVFGDGAALEKEFAEAFKHMRYYYPDFEAPKVQTIVSGLEHDLYISDSLIIVGLDWYLGKGAKYRPRGLFDYILKRYEKEYIVPSCMLLYGISPRYNKNDPKDKTILADAITYGKSFYFTKSMMPCTPDSLLIWYTSEEIAGVRENQKTIWAHLIENDILYKTDHFIKRKYIEDRPKTYEIGEKCPGRIATWVGWQIVEQYMQEKNDAPLPELMQKDNAQLIFSESKYRPE